MNSVERVAVSGFIWIAGLKLRRYDRELSELVEDYLMALCVVWVWASCWWLSIGSTGRERPRGVRILASLASVACLVGVAAGLYQVLQIACGMPAGLVQQVLQIALGFLVWTFYDLN